MQKSEAASQVLPSWFCYCIILLYHILSCFLINFLCKWYSNLLWKKVLHLVTDRNSHRRWTIKAFVFKNFAKFTGKHLCRIPLFKMLQAVLKKRIQYKVSYCKFCEIFKNNFLKKNKSVQLLLDWIQIW